MRVLTLSTKGLVEGSASTTNARESSTTTRALAVLYDMSSFPKIKAHRNIPSFLLIHTHPISQRIDLWIIYTATVIDRLRRGL